MPKNPIDRVEIVEPPIGELTKKTHPIRRSCLTSCLSIIIFVVLVFVGVRLYLRAGPSTGTSVPANFPSSIPLYDRKNIERVTTIPGTYKARAVALSLVIPHLLLSNQYFNQDDQSNAAITNLSDLWNILKNPPGSDADTIRVEWHNLGADPGFIASYYRGELRRAGFSVADTKNAASDREMTFTNGTVSGTFEAVGVPSDHPGTDNAILTVAIPVQR